MTWMLWIEGRREIGRGDGRVDREEIGEGRKGEGPEGDKDWKGSGRNEMRFIEGMGEIVWR